MKWLSSTTDSETSSSAKRRKVSIATNQKWKAEFDKERKTVTWLDCDTTGTGSRKTVDNIKRSVCIKYEAKIQTRRNYSNKWVVGADSVRCSNIKNH